MIGASIISDDAPKSMSRNSRISPKNVNNPVFGEDNENPYNTGTINGKKKNE